MECGSFYTVKNLSIRNTNMNKMGSDSKLIYKRATQQEAPALLS